MNTDFILINNNNFIKCSILPRRVEGIIKTSAGQVKDPVTSVRKQSKIELVV